MLATAARFCLRRGNEFVLKRDIVRAYERDFHDIGFGVTISGPLVVSRMTSTIDVQPGEKVLEIGTGSGNQSAYLSNLIPVLTADPPFAPPDLHG